MKDSDIKRLLEGQAKRVPNPLCTRCGHSKLIHKVPRKGIYKLLPATACSHVARGLGTCFCKSFTQSYYP